MTLTPGRLRRGFGPIYRRLFRCGDELSPWEKLVFANLLERMGQNNRAWPSQQLIADDLGISIRTVRGAIASLRDREFLRTQKHAYGGALTYEINLELVLDWAEHRIATKILAVSP